MEMNWIKFKTPFFNLILLIYLISLTTSDVALSNDSRIRLGLHRRAVRSIQFSPKGRVLAVANGSNVKLWDVNKRDGITELKGHQSDVTSIAFSPDGRMLVSGSDDRTLRLWNVETGKEIAKFKGHERSIKSVAFSPDGQTFASASLYGYGTIKLWDVASRQEIQSFEGKCYAVAFSPNGQAFATATADDNIELFSIDEKRHIDTCRGHIRDVYSVAFSLNGDLFASGSDDRTVKLWNFDGGSGKISATFTGHSDSVNSVAFSPDGLLASGSKDGTIKLWDVSEMRDIAIKTFREHSKGVNAVAFSPDGLMLATGGEDRQVFLWNLASVPRQRAPNLSHHTAQVNSIAFSPNGQILASASADKSIKLWNIADSSELATLSEHSGWVTAVAFSPAGDILASASDDRSLVLWSTSDRKKIVTLGNHTERVNDVAFSPEGWILASASDDNIAGVDATIKLWDVLKNREIAVLVEDGGSVETIAFSPDGQILASGGYDNVVNLYDLASKKKIVSFRGHSAPVLTVAFSPDGEMLASGSRDNSVKIWSVLEQQELVTLDEHTAYVKSVAFSLDGKVLASAAVDFEIKLWSVDDYQLLNQRKYKGGMKSLAFSRDGLLASAGSQGAIFLWNLSDIIGPPIQPPNRIVPKIVIHSPLDDSIFPFNDEIEISGTVIDPNQVVNLKIMVADIKGARLYSEDLQVLRGGVFRKVIPEVSGINQVTVTAKYKTGINVSDKIIITRESPLDLLIDPTEDEVDPIIADKDAPDFEIISPVFHNSTVTLDAEQTKLKIRATDVSGVEEVTVNGMPTQKVGTDIYEISVPIKAGNNSVNLSVRDIPGNVTIGRVTIIRPNSDTTRPNIVILSPTERIVSPTVKDILVTGIATDESGIYEIQINGEEATVVENGGFRATVLLGYGDNEIVVTATDTKLNTTTQRIKITRSLERPRDTTGPKIRILTPHVSVQRGAKVKPHVTTDTIRVTGTVTDPSGIYEVTVNGTEVIVSENRFSTTIQLVRGDNRILVNAIDTLQNTTTEEFTIVREQALYKKQGTDYALLFATDSYDHWENLRNPLFDAQAIRVALQETYGFQVELIHNPTRDGILEALRRYAEKEYADEDQLLIFFAGHGYFDATFSVGYLVAKDTKTPENDNAMGSYLSHSVFRDIIDRMGCKHIFLVMDTCYSGTFDHRIAMRGEVNNIKPFSQADIDQKLKYTTRWYLTSGAKEQVSDGIPGYHSPFVRELLKALRSKGGNDSLLTVEEVLAYFDKLDDPKPCSDEFGRNEPGSDFLFITK